METGETQEENGCLAVIQARTILTWKETVAVEKRKK